MDQIQFKTLGICCDHAGWEIKNQLINEFKNTIKFIDYGCFNSEPVDYPDVAKNLAHGIASCAVEAGVAICGTGIGMSIALNKFRGIRAACAWDSNTATLSRQHNHANVLCLGTRTLSQAEVKACIEAWIHTEPALGRHADRVLKLQAIEQENFPQKPADK